MEAVIEDTVVGVRAGVAAGMTVFGFGGAGHTDPRELRNAGAVTFHDMLALQALLD
jgi:beta-phosphoglucomutase-like phosphatase (HAD superfamily)